jgi:hypothetical protein
MTDKAEDRPESAAGSSSRRTLLKLGAMAAPAVITLKPAMANVQTSMAMCRIPVEVALDAQGRPRNAAAGAYGAESLEGGVDGDGYFAPPPKGYYYGQELIDYKRNGTLPDGIYSQDQFEAHLSYIKNLRPGDSGFSCVASLVQQL